MWRCLASPSPGHPGRDPLRTPLDVNLPAPFSSPPATSWYPNWMPQHGQISSDGFGPSHERNPRSNPQTGQRCSRSTASMVKLLAVRSRNPSSSEARAAPGPACKNVLVAPFALNEPKVFVAGSYTRIVPPGPIFIGKPPGWLSWRNFEVIPAYSSAVCAPKSCAVASEMICECARPPESPPFQGQAWGSRTGTTSRRMKAGLPETFIGSQSLVDLSILHDDERGAIGQSHS